MTEIILALVLMGAALLAGWKIPSLRREALIAALLAIPLLFLPLLSGGNVYPALKWQLLIVMSVGALADLLYYKTLRRLLTPVMHPKRVHLRWLIAMPVVALIAFELFNIPLLVSVILTFAIGLFCCAIMGGSLVWDALASSLAFGLLYVALYMGLGIPIENSSAIIGYYSGLALFNYPIEQVLLVVVYGALWGPICAAFRYAEDDTLYHHGHQRVKRGVIAVVALVAAATGYWAHYQFIKVPIVSAAPSSTAGDSISLTDPIRISFDRPIDRNRVVATISPQIVGEVAFDDPYLQRTFVRQFIFTPTTHLAPDTTYTVTLSHVANVLGEEEKEYQIRFKTPGLPAFTSTSLVEGQQGVDICTGITVQLNQSINRLAEFSFKLSGDTEIEARLAADKKSYLIKPKNCLAQGRAYSLDITRLLTIYNPDGKLVNADDPELVKTLHFTTKSAPGISNFSPQGNTVLAGTREFTVSFAEAMVATDMNALAQIKPPLKGSWKWTTNKTLIFTAEQNLPLDTSYEITIPKGIKDIANGFLPEDAHFSFSTVGPVQVSSFSPHSSSGGVSVNAAIKVTFDQPVDHASAEQRFSLNPAADGSFSWQGQTLVYKTTLAKDTNYQVSMAGGVGSEIGLPSKTSFSSTFRTEESTTLLSIPVYYQQKPLSCEAASLYMALKYKGSGVSEAAILAAMGADASPRQNNVWADPDLIFVGNVNGHQNTTGYGVHAAPISAVASSYRSNEVISGSSAATLAGILAAGDPIVFWGTAGRASRDTWQTPAGRSINAWVGEHVRLLVGFTGAASSPTGFIINDPIFGRLRWTPSQLTGNMSAFNGMAVVIH